MQLVALHPASGQITVHRADSATKLASAILGAKTLNENGHNIYFEVNLGEARDQRSKAGNITHLRAVVGDVDAKGARNIDDCMVAVAALPLPPTFATHTGGGIQVFYFLHSMIAATPEHIATYVDIGQALRDVIDGDAVFDLPRMMRMPGFVNHPTAKKLATGRVPTKAKVLSASGRRYNLAELAAAFALPVRRDAAHEFRDVNAELSDGLTADRWFERLSPDYKDACLSEILMQPNIMALADTSDGAAEPNWRTVLAACARSGAPNAFEICRAWAQTSPRFDANDFTSRWKSYHGR